MTGQINDLWVSYLQGEGYVGKQYNDLIRQALQDKIPSTRNQINDLWALYLNGEGYTGTINGMMYQWLGDKGYEGNLNDRVKQALEESRVFFTPSQLFDNGADGVWYDPSDLTTMFRDEAGTMPVTSDGDPVGLILDKSQGTSTGPQLVPDYSFNDSGAWTTVLNGDPGGSGVVADGSVTAVPGGAGGFANRTDVQSTSFTVESGAWYRVTANVISSTAGNFILPFVGGSLAISPASVGGVEQGENTVISYMFYSTGTSAFITVRSQVGEIVVGEVSVNKIPGNHASQSTTSEKPTYRTDGTHHWLQFDGVDDRLLLTSYFTGTEDRSFVINYLSERPDATGGAGYLFDVGDRTATNGSAWGISPEFTALWVRIVGAASWDTPSPENDNYVSTIRWGTSLGTTVSDTQVYANGTAMSQASSTGATVDVIDAGQSVLGSRNDLRADFYVGRMYGFVGTNSLLTDSEKEETEKYLGNKSGLVL